MSRLGSRSKRIEIQRYTTVVGTAGTRTRTWLKLADAWANVQEKYGSEPLKSGTDYPVLRVHFTIRDVSGVLPEYRVLYEGRYHEIIEVKEVTYQRNRYLELITEKRGNQEGTATSLPSCADGAFVNSDGTYSVAVPSGETVTSDDITVTEIDGTTRDDPSNKDVTCLWKTLQLQASDGVDVFVDGQVNNDVSSYPSGGVIAVSDLNVRDGDGFNSSYPRRLQVVITGAAIQGIVQDATSTKITVPTVPTQSGIAYMEAVPLNTSDSLRTGDCADRYQNGEYSRVSPAYPASYAKVDYEAAQSDVRGTAATGTSLTDLVAPTILVDNNAFGNKFRFTDDAGNPSDASVGSNIWAHVDWLRHSFTGATDNYVIDHLYGIGIYIDYLIDDGKYSLAVNESHGQSWNNWIDYIAGLGTFAGYTGWRPVDLSFGMAGSHGAKVQRGIDWADEFFNLQRSDNRGGIMTGETAHTDSYLWLYDSESPDMVDAGDKATYDGGFQSDITQVFIIRNHY